MRQSLHVGIYIIAHACKCINCNSMCEYKIKLKLKKDTCIGLLKCVVVYIRSTVMLQFLNLMFSIYNTYINLTCPKWGGYRGVL